MKRNTILFAIAATVIVATSSARAEQVCMDADEMGAALIDWYGEAPVTPREDNARQVWASSVTGTWTLVQYLADGQSCVIAQGDDWRKAAPNAEMMAALAD